MLLQPIANQQEVDADPAIDRVGPTSVRPETPPRLAAELKFSECLPPQIAAAVVEGRLSDRAALDEAMRRPRRVITADT
jgi:hypothetical protein